MMQISLPLRLQLSLIIVIGAAFLKYHTWSNLLVYGVIALVWIYLLQVPLPKLGGLLGTELIFLSLVALPLGWERASFLLVRSLICLIVMNGFLLTLPPHSLGIALKSLPIPAPLKENLILAGQYLEILLLEVTRMQRSAQLRGLNGTAGWLRYASAAMIGALYLRTLDRAERVYGAMVARGYNGQLPLDSPPKPKERFILLIAGVIAACLTLSSYLTVI
ncbi:energy-coupling factor transporter transmembrane component T [Aphanizomenon flos-aquae NRERC-008]|jgi:cobalt/nickel transport system permease protein|uniref:Energy-coupling factor transporter transmembrane protein EcfT n=1 Tax=Aphanizomenon flos-aquae FACHB-1249 TaxID=2692889 RepID=A0ABR8IV07_APHFL|nr:MULTISPECIES: energy-coupling factor transporter transmembrane component T [Aphanizomenon]MBD2391811.1 energy-coupling factor transporter transmembrane protein EcfT [Aphanizomenon flos-aquae FACHB-1171]MBD2558475.1 energy-coupling factor transporter transmembrane protein EcfT [Aphanizomenon flos-aquae FACHB-1290]MBD2632720.1 energy-coupling factor transporter transmembrane protein EcfT [Aphanizomenon sp. FACHB-1399]MBD2643539.1 energy-coupling factor transporter transmembrane protein EcfT [A